ncbi:MAG: DUF4268 domain-containing protein [Verrucomicrobiales bacterium]
MPLYRLTSSKLESIPTTTFAAENIFERKDIQRLLRTDISPLGDDLMVIAEEFCDWEDCNRRMDLLCLSKNASLVVVEIKRTEDGGHMELQALRYAAMVSSMTMEQAIEAYANLSGKDTTASRQAIIDFLEPDSEEEEALSGAVRIILVSADFSTELTSTVMWLNKFEIDITCIRLRPYKVAGECLIDATQIIPLPEAADYEIRIRNREREKQKVKGVRQEIYREFWDQLILRSKTKTQLFANRNAKTRSRLSAAIGRSGFGLRLLLTQDKGTVDCYIELEGKEQNRAALNALLARRQEIEATFGSHLEWVDPPDTNACRIEKEVTSGWKSPESDWPAMQDQMIEALIRLEAALKQPIQELKV